MLDKLDLVVEIEELLEECGYYPFGDDYCDNKYPYELITSPSINNGKFTIENFLLWQNFIESISWDEFVSDVELAIINCEDDYPDIAEQYQKFLDFIQEKFNYIQIYKVKLEEINEGENQFEEAHIYCIIGAIGNLWLGLTPRLDNEWYYGNTQSSNTNLTPEIKKVINTLKSDYQESLLLLSMAVDDCLTNCKTEVVYSRHLIIEKLLDSACYCWSKNYIANSKYKIGGKIDKLLRDNLSEVKKHYVWGFDGWFIYIGGIAEDGDWIGLYTREEYYY